MGRVRRGVVVPVGGVAGAMVVAPVHAQSAAPAHARSPAVVEAKASVRGVVIHYAVGGPAEGGARSPDRRDGDAVDGPAVVADRGVGGTRVPGHRARPRGAGLSTHLEAIGRPDGPAVFAALGTGGEPPLAYTLGGLAEDAVGVLDALSVERAHLFGVSTGGMIAQIVAARPLERTLSLTSAMAGSGNPAIRVPTVVLHGADDPLVPVEAGREVADPISGAEFRVMPGMGHDLPDALVPVGLDAITTAAARSSRREPRD